AMLSHQRVVSVPLKLDAARARAERSLAALRGSRRVSTDKDGTISTGARASPFGLLNPEPPLIASLALRAIDDSSTKAQIMARTAIRFLGITPITDYGVCKRLVNKLATLTEAPH